MLCQALLICTLSKGAEALPKLQQSVQEGFVTTPLAGTPLFNLLATTILLEAASHADAEARQAVNSAYTALESGTQCSGGGGGGDDSGGRRLAGALPAPPGGQCSVSAPE